MKKIVGIITALLLVLLPFANVSAESKATTNDPVNFYIFYGSTCGYCASLHEYMDELVKDEEVNYMFNVVNYEVWGDSTNAALMTAVGEKFDTEVTGVPFYVVGDKYFSGYSEASQTSIVDAIKEAYNNKDYVDVVASVGKGNADTTDGEATEESDNKDYTGYIILGAIVVIIIAVVLSRQKTNYYEEVVEEKVETIEEEKVEEPKATKKTTTSTKKATSAKKTTSTAKKSTSTAKKTTSGAKKKTTTTKKTTSKK